MASVSQPPKGRDGAPSTLDTFIQALKLAKETCGIPPAQVAFGTASALLTIIRVHFPLLSVSEDELLTGVVQDTMANYQDYVDLGRACGDVCQALYRRLGKVWMSSTSLSLTRLEI
jgi:hypothetical protein